MKPTVPEVMPLVEALYRTDRGVCGCCLHIILDDGNCEQSHADFCLGYAREHGHPDCITLAKKLVQMSDTQRRKIYAKRWRR